MTLKITDNQYGRLF